MTNKHYRTCNLCEAMCGVVITHENGKILSIKGDKDDPFSRGHICPKATALQDIYEDPDRLKHPVRRTATGWERISWDEAFDEVANNIKAIQAQHGNNSVGIYLGNPNVHNLGSMLVGSTFTRALRTTNRFSATSADQLPSHFASRHMFGHFFLIPIPDVDRTDFFLILGANPLASNGSLMTAGGIEPRMKALQKRGGKIVVVDPRRTETAKMADQHLFVRPGSDVLLLLAMVQVILADGLAQPVHLEAMTDGLDTIWEVVKDYAPERVAGRTGIPTATIHQLAHDFASADSAVCYGRMGVSTQAFGGLCQWLINVLNIITGNLDKAGGAMFPTPAFDTVTAGRKGKFGRWRSRVSGLPEFIGELPCAVMAEEMLTPGDGQIKAMATVAGNPVLSTPNGGQLDEALAGLDFMVSIDIYINETTRHANIILPPTTGIETDHYDVVFHALALRNSAKYSPALFEPEADTRHDWQIYRELSRRLATTDRPFDERNPLNQATPAMMLDFGLQTGPHKLSLDQLRENPHGIDLGAMEPCLPDRLFTPEKRINLVPDVCVTDLARVEETFFAENGKANGYDLQLIGRRQLRDNNSWMHNAPRLMRGKERCTVLISAEDAHSRNLTNGQQVSVASRVGQIELPVEISDTMMTGVVSIPHGWGHGRKGVQMRVAQQHIGASINDLTDDSLLDQLTGNAAFNGVPVRIKAIS